MPTDDANDGTLETYQLFAERYVDRTPSPDAGTVRFVDQFIAVVPGRSVLEFGSGPGHDAAYMETRGLQVTRTDAARAFVERLIAAGHSARLLDVRVDDFGGPYDGIWANAVLLHLDRKQFAQVVSRARRAVVDNGVLGISLKEGDGAGWTTRKMDAPRYFTYWREADVRRVLVDGGWTVQLFEHSGHQEKWLHFIARAT